MDYAESKFFRKKNTIVYEAPVRLYITLNIKSLDALGMPCTILLFLYIKWQMNSSESTTPASDLSQNIFSEL
jgi:hypothetical protein